MKPNHRSIRLPGYDYASGGWYFVTMCCHERQHLFRHVRLDLHAGELQFAPTAIKIKEMDFKIWQRNYYEHIIRNAESHNKIAAYIRNNPGNWQEDEYFL